jgi:hypothetical protein
MHWHTRSRGSSSNIFMGHILSFKPLGQYLSRDVCHSQNLLLECLQGFRSHFLLFMSPLVLRLNLLDLCITVFFQLRYIFITWCRNVDNMFSSCLSKRIMFVVWYVCSLLVSLYVNLQLFHVLPSTLRSETCFSINKNRLLLTLSTCVLRCFIYNVVIRTLFVPVLEEVRTICPFPFHSYLFTSFQISCVQTISRHMQT